jgi:DNA-binding CsgD family transcriptional regulator
MTPNQTSFTFEEIKEINATIGQMYCNSKINSSFADFASDFIQTLKRQLYFDKGNFMFFRHDRVNNLYEVTSFIQTGWALDDVERYVDTYVHIDDILPILMQRNEIAFRNGDIFSQKERRKTKYYQEFIEPAHIKNSIDANLILPETFDVNAIIGIFRDPGRKEFTDKDLEIVRTYQKHLSRILEHYFEAEGVNSQGNFFNLFDSFDSLGVCIIDKNMNIVTYNSTYKKFSSFSESHFSPPPDTNALFRHLASLCDIIIKNPTQTKIGPVEFCFSDSNYLTEIVLEKHPGEPQKNRFICLVYSPSDFFVQRVTRLSKEYNLSGREFEVLFELMKNGLTIDEISKKLFISASTVKKHISSAYQKLGVKNQKQLLSLLHIT